MLGVGDAFAEAPPGRPGIAATHHPLTHRPKVEKRPMAGAPEAPAALANCGADVMLCGHLHAWAAAPMTAREGGREVLMVQAGTTLSTRLRGGENDSGLLIVEGQRLTVERWAAGEVTAFRRRAVHRFRREGETWRRQVQSSTTLPDDPERIAAKPAANSSTLSLCVMTARTSSPFCSMAIILYQVSKISRP
jgi:hypothetical protein